MNVITSLHTLCSKITLFIVSGHRIGTLNVFYLRSALINGRISPEEDSKSMADLKLHKKKIVMIRLSISCAVFKPVLKNYVTTLIVKFFCLWLNVKTFDKMYL